MSWSSVALLLWASLVVSAHAAELQRDQPIFIESDSLKIDDVKGISIYQGNVIFRQGPDSLKADELVIRSSQQQQIDKIIATGQPARFDHDVELHEEKSWGEAETIEYYANRSLVVLNGSAHFQQGDNQFSGNRIEYESDKKLVRAGKNVAGEGRVQIVIHPRKNAEEKSAPE